MKIQMLIGLTIVAIKGTKDKKDRKTIPFEFILFDDGESFISFEEQDYYSYHDCSSSARHISFNKDKSAWNNLMQNPMYGDANPITNEYPF